MTMTKTGKWRNLTLGNLTLENQGQEAMEREMTPTKIRWKRIPLVLASVLDGFTMDRKDIKDGNFKGMRWEFGFHSYVVSRFVAYDADLAQNP